MLVTKKIVKSGMSDAGGWSKYQLSLLGVSWPPKKGWLSKLIGQDFAKDVIFRFLSEKKDVKVP